MSSSKGSLIRTIPAGACDRTAEALEAARTRHVYPFELMAITRRSCARNRYERPVIDALGNCITPGSIVMRNAFGSTPLEIRVGA